MEGNFSVCLRLRSAFTRFLAVVIALLLPIAGVILISEADAEAHEGNFDPNVIHACVQKNSNRVEIVGVNGKCSKAEEAVHWSIAGAGGGASGQGGIIGPPGPVGPQGPAGPAGPQGPAGPTGPQGPQGERGADGAAGATGAQGPQGPQGERGADGAAGSQGVQGPQGDMGPAGPKGDPGVLNFVIATSLPDVRLTTAQTTGAWFSLPGRSVTINKTSNTSKLRITYQDTLGSRAAMYNACQWRFMLDGNVVKFFSDADVESGFGWRMTNGAHVAWSFNVPAGAHTVRVDALRNSSATECLSGWNNIGNFLSIEEIP
jgi:hypothetical protein